MDYNAPSYREDHVSQIPALQLLQNLGFKYLTPEEALRLRGSRASNVLLEGILVEQLRQMNRVLYKGHEYPFTEGNILSAVQALKEVMYDGLIRTNEKIYDLICLGKSLQQSMEGDIKSFTLQYIDWEHPERNVYHCTAEFAVEKSGTNETRRPDIIVFVNGIPLAVIECKSPKQKEPMAEAIKQMRANQKDGEIPKLFIYSQLLLAISMNEAKYATVGTDMKFWATWKENFSLEEKKALADFVNQPLPPEEKDRLFSAPFKYARRNFDALEEAGPREVTEQDRAIYSLCRPERLLELSYRYILYDAGERKIARYQQYFCVKKIMSRILTKDNEGMRKGGVVWHTQGSGKSLTMVMLAKAIALEPTINNERIILVTDRVDLDDQLYNTFRACGKEPIKARTGWDLIEKIVEHKERIITTVIDKFEAAVGKQETTIKDPNIFVLVDEGHRTQYGSLHAKMRKVLPEACFIGFTGTPVMKKEKSTIDKFGGLIDTYPITQAVKDEAVVPLLYEGRHVEQKVDSESIDSWFEKITANLSKEQTVDLKKKFATTEQLNKAEQKVMRVAWDIGVHFRDNWQGTGFKAQLVAQDKATALLYKKYLDQFGMVTSEVLISGPDEWEGDEDIYAEDTPEINRFWKSMMERFGNEKDYNKQLINSFKHGEQPEIIIVVDKLITGFDAPRNTVMYLTRKLKDHTLLQAIARVNRLHDGKEFGYIIDYRGVLENLDSALDLYGSLEEFERADLEGILTDVEAEIAKLPQQHSELWDIFKGVENKGDVEAYERLLADEARRPVFYDKFSAFARTLAIAFSSVRFIEETPQKRQAKYCDDLKFFKNLRYAVKRRYAEIIDFSQYEPKIKKLIDTHVGTGEIEQITPPVNIFDQEAFAKEVDKIANTSAKADTIAHRTMKTINDRWQEDPAFYEKFSKMLQDIINAFRLERIKANEYLNKVTEVMNSVLNRTGDDIPSILNGHEIPKAFYGCINKVLCKEPSDRQRISPIGAEAALAIDMILEKRRIINWVTNIDVQNQMKNDMEDFLFSLRDRDGIELSFEDVDTIMEQCLDIFKVRRL